MADDGSTKPVTDLLFRPGEHGFVFYDENRFDRGSTGRAWAFTTINEAAAWLLDQFPSPIFDGDGAKASAAPAEAPSAPSEASPPLGGLS